MPKAIFPLELQAACGISRKKLRQWLQDVARDTNRARNAMLRHWINKRQDDPDWQPKVVTKKDGTVKTWKGKPVLDPFVKGERTELYRVGNGVARRTAAKLISAASGEVLDKLAANVPYNHEGEARWQWEAMMDYEMNHPSWRSLCIPVPSQDSCLYYRGSASRELSTGVMQRVRRYAGNGAVVRFVLFKRDSGYSKSDAICRIAMSSLSRGNRKLMHRIAKGEIKFSDSKIVEKKGKWFLQLCYEMPTVDHKLNEERVATLEMGDRRALVLFGHDSSKPIALSLDKPFLAEHERLILRRKTLRYRSRHGHGRGHGKVRYYERLRPHSRRFLDMQDEYRRKFLADLISACIREDCGTVLYREPTKPLREKSPLAKAGVPMNWSEFLPQLKFKLQQHNIKCDVKRMGVKEWREKNDSKDTTSTAASATSQCV